MVTEIWALIGLDLFIITNVDTCLIMDTGTKIFGLSFAKEIFLLNHGLVRTKVFIFVMAIHSLFHFIILQSSIIPSIYNYY